MTAPYNHPSLAYLPSNRVEIPKCQRTMFLTQALGSDAEQRERLWGWDLHTMDELQGFMEDQVSTNVIETLEKQSFLKKSTAKDDDTIRKIISSGVVDAFQQYKDQLDCQQTLSPGPMPVPREREEDIREPLEEGNEKPFIACSKLREDSPIMTVSSRSTGHSDYTDFSLASGFQFTEVSDLTAEPQVATEFDQFLSWEPFSACSERHDRRYAQTMEEDEAPKPAGQVLETSDQLDLHLLHETTSLQDLANTDFWDSVMEGH